MFSTIFASYGRSTFKGQQKHHFTYNTLTLQSISLTMEIGKGEAHPSRLAPLAEAYQIHQQLQNTINDMDSKIQEVIKCHQAEFLLAYRTHILKIKQELSEIKQRGEEQQKKMLSNERSVFLEKQIILFREQALRLYNKLQEISEQNDLLKAEARELNKTNELLQRQNKDQAKQLKLLQTENSMLEAQIERLQHNSKQFQQVFEGKGKISRDQTTKTYIDSNAKALTTPKPRHSFNLPLPLRSRKVSLTGELLPKEALRGKHSEGRSLDSSQHPMDHELKGWFVSCLERIRRQVGQRRANGSRGEQIQKVASWQEFRMIDKLRLLEMFMQNQKLLVWIYQKIFPSRINQIQEYLSKCSGVFPKSNSINIKMGDIQLPEAQLVPPGQVQIDLPFFPQVSQSEKKTSKTTKSIIAGRSEVRNGKLLLAKREIEHD